MVRQWRACPRLQEEVSCWYVSLSIQCSERRASPPSLAFYVGITSELMSKLRRIWQVIRGEPRDDYVDQFWAAFLRDARDARPGWLIGGVIAVIVIIVVGALFGAVRK